MRFDLDAKVRTADGEEAGTLQWAIVDPQTREVTHFVISTDALFGRAVQVPRDEVERASRDGEVIQLGLTREQLEHLPSHVPDTYGPPPSGWLPSPAFAFPPGAYLWPAMTPVVPMTAPGMHAGATASDVATPGTIGASTPAQQSGATEIAIGKGAAVIDSSGDDIGVVDEIYYEEHSGTLRGFSLRIGGTLRTLFGGGETVEVPARTVERIGESTVYLNVEKEALTG